MSRSTLRFALTIGFLCWPLSALALVPPNITGLSASIGGGQLTVRWNAPEGGSDITVYRIYYGQQSIMENNGAYDDFLAISGDQTELIITDLPPYPEIYVAVAAVSSSDEESDSFVEEARVDLTQEIFDGEIRTGEAASPARKLREESTLGLISARNTSLAGISLVFTSDVQVPPDQASDAVSVSDDAGQPVALHKLILLGNEIRVETDPLEPGRSYAVRANPIVMGFIAPDRALPLDAARSIASFTAEGAADPTPSPATLPQIDEPMADIQSIESEVHNFRTSIEPEGDTGRSTVIVGWDAPTLGIVQSYGITPIVGPKLGKTTDVGSATRVVRFRKIPGGLFRVAILTRFEDGSVAGPTTISLMLPGEEPLWSASAPNEPEVQSPQKSGGLTASGIGVTGIAAVSGVLAGFKHFRRKRKIHDAMEPLVGLS